jgi:hypothetical protein
MKSVSLSRQAFTFSGYGLSAISTSSGDIMFFLMGDFMITQNIADEVLSPPIEQRIEESRTSI